MSHPLRLRRAMSALGLVLSLALTAEAQVFPIQQEYQPTAAHIMHAQPSDGPFLPQRPNEPPATGMYTEPEFVPYVNDLQMFDQPDLSAYGRGPRPTEGWFGSAEVITWAISTPPKTLIGAPGAVRVWQPGATSFDTGNVEPNQLATGNGYTGTAPSDVLEPARNDAEFGGVLQTSSLDTGFLEAQFTTGSRFEFGRINDGRGWLVSTFHLGAQTQNFEASKAAINFGPQPIGWVGTYTDAGVFTFVDVDGDGAIGPLGIDRSNPRNGTADPLPIDSEGIEPDFDDAVRLPTVFEYVKIENRTAMWGVETMRMWRPVIGPRGGIWELFLGPRYVNINDTFLVDARATDDSVFTVPLPFYNTFVNTEVDNNIFGLQFGGRWAIQRDRWQLSLESRGLAAVNFQNTQQTGKFDNEFTYQNNANTFVTVFAANGANNGQLPHAFSSSASDVLFSPGGEFRANLKYQMFRSVYLQLGYTGLFISNVGRGSNMTQYSFPTMRINESANKEFFFAQGADFGIVINR